MFAMLGVSQYAVREGARIRENKVELNRFASEIFSLNIISTAISYIGLICLTFTWKYLSEYRTLIFISSISIAFTTLGIEWVNTIFEDYIYITIRSIIINVLTLALVFLCVKDENDIYVYAFLSVLGNIITSLFNWRYCRKYIKLKITTAINAKTHIRPILTLFANCLATNIYVNSDITMLGLFTNDYTVGIYSLSVKIYSVIKNIIAALYTVTIPRISFYIGNKDYLKVKELYSNVVSTIILLLLPTSAGIIAIAPEIIRFMGGNEYSDSIIPLRILGISLVGAILAGLLTYCLNIPFGKEKINFQATILSAFINMGLNFVLIRVLKQNGAAITTVISEFCVFFYCLIKSRNELHRFLDIDILKKNTLDAFAGVIIVFICSWFVHSIIDISIISMILIIIMSVIIYGLFLLMAKNDVVMGGLKRGK